MAQINNDFDLVIDTSIVKFPFEVRVDLGESNIAASASRILKESREWRAENSLEIDVDMSTSFHWPYEGRAELIFYFVDDGKAAVFKLFFGCTV